jgi:hypothetical protein
LRRGAVLRRRRVVGSSLPSHAVDRGHRTWTSTRFWQVLVILVQAAPMAATTLSAPARVDCAIALIASCSLI